MVAMGPTPDFDRVLCQWAGVDLDGMPSTGTIRLEYTGGVMLDDDPVLPVSIYPKRIEATLSTTTIMVDLAGNGTLVPQTVGFASFLVPASNDNNIQGTGAPYRITELLSSGAGQTKLVMIDKDAAQPLWLNRLTSVGGTTVVVSAVTVGEFNQVKQRVLDLETGGVPSSGAVAWTAVSGKPTTYPPQVGTTAGVAAAGNDSRLSDTRIPTDASVTNAKVATNAAIALSKLAETTALKLLTTELRDKLAALPDPSLIPTLTGGKLATTVIPAIAIHDYLGAVSSQAAMLALTGQRGDYCTRTDGANVGEWRLIADDPTLIGSWLKINSGVTGVTSINGLSGTVVINADSLAEGTTKKFMTQAERDQLAGLGAVLAAKADLSGGKLFASQMNETYATAPAGSLFVLRKSGGVWPSARPSSRTDIEFAWDGPDPSPPMVTSGTGGMLDGVDYRWRS